MICKRCLERMLKKRRRLSNAELADLPAAWENSWLDQSKYHTSVIPAYEVDQATYRAFKAEGVICQKYKERYYIG